MGGCQEAKFPEGAPERPQRRGAQGSSGRSEHKAVPRTHPSPPTLAVRPQESYLTSLRAAGSAPGKQG